MIYSANAISKTAPIQPASRRRRPGATFSAICLAALPALASVACSAADTPASSGASTDTGERNRGLDTDGYDSQSASGTQGGGSVRVDHPYLSGTCTADATVSMVNGSSRYVTVLFSNQQYAGDRNDPDYLKARTEGRLLGDARSTTPKCVLHVPMKVTAGYRFSPTNIIVRGFAHNAFVFGAYRWANGGSQEYTFERQVPLNEPAGLRGDNFVYTEPLHGLWSPTCGSSSSGEVDAEFIVTLQPYTAAGNRDSIVAIDSFDVAGLGSLEKCGSPPSYDRVAQEGEACGIVEMDYVHPVRCDTQKQTNICVYSDTNDSTGTCVNASRRPSQSELVVGYDDECGGPFYKYCDKEEGLICRFRSGDARQNASSHYGRCVEAVPVGGECIPALYGACNGYTCNTTLDPCEAGATCKNGRCATAQGNSSSAQDDSQRDSHSD